MLSKIFITVIIAFVVSGITTYAQQSYYLNALTIDDENGQIIYKETESGKLLEGECKIFSGYYNPTEHDFVHFSNGKKSGKEIHYQKGKKIAECYYKDGYLDGMLKEFDLEGNVLRKVLFVNNKMEGPDTYYFSDGVILKEANYKNGVLNGQEITYDYETRKIKSETNYVNGVLDGKQFNTDWNNDIGDYFIKSEYKNGALTDYTEYYVTGELLTTKTLLSENSSVDHTYRKDGSLLSECTYKGPYLDGKQTYYYPDGKEEVEFFCKENYKHGQRTEFYPDGTLKSTYNYANGLFDGLSEIFYPNGEKQSECNYKQNCKTGPYKIFFDNGQIREEGEFNGTGDYSDSNYVYQKTYYKNGKLNTYSINFNGVWTILESYIE